MLEKLLVAGLLVLLLGVIFLVPALAMPAAGPDLVRVQVGETWYRCEITATATPHPIFQTATAWQPPPTPTQEVTPLEQRYRARQGMNLRAWPSLSAPVVGGLGAGQRVTIVATEADDNYTWGQLDTGAWVAMETSSGFRYLLQINE